MQRGSRKPLRFTLRAGWSTRLAICMACALLPPRGAAADTASAVPAVAVDSVEQVQDMLARAGALAARLTTPENTQRLQPLAARVAELTRRVGRQEPDAAPPPAALSEIAAEARRLARQIAFCNPRLDSDSRGDPDAPADAPR
ncbi:MAG: hypothetical protein GXY58_13085 [Planctomycetaceae bacterium]|nr:hypothetical protein [Planctomycetaceae bacterium]